MSATMVCLNEVCEYYARNCATKLQWSFKHCPNCGAKLTDEDVAMYMLKEKKK